MLKEFCAENLTGIDAAIEKGIQRVELCDNLAVGGTTPSYGVIKKAVEIGKKEAVGISTMIRPRGGNFHYTEEEIEVMKEDILQVKELGSTGVVLGCLTAEQRIHREHMLACLSLCEGMEVTFHMAFDQIEKEQQKEELEWLIEQGVTRILTHGGLGGAVEDHVDWINELISHAQGKIEVLVGGGVHKGNVEELANRIHTDQFHGTKIV